MTKIAGVRATAHSRPFEGQLVRNALGANTKRDIVVVRITADDGTVGYGEAHHGQNPTAMAEIVEHGLGTLIQGADPFDSEGIWARLAHQQVVTHGLRRRQRDRPLGNRHRALGPQGQAAGPAGLSAAGRAPGASALMPAACPSASSRSTRWSWRSPAWWARATARSSSGSATIPKRDAERVAHIRKAFPTLDIAVDAQTRYSPLDMPEVLHYCEENRVYWLEEPFTPDNLDAYAETSAKNPDPAGRGREPLYAARPSATSSRGAASASSRPTAPRPAGSARSRRSPTWPPPGTC